MSNEYTITDPADLAVVVTVVLDWVKKNKKDKMVLALQGDLGAGKTTFTQELAKYLKVTEVVMSPTFAIVKSYTAKHELFDTLVHIDAYRLEDETEVSPLRLTEVFAQPRTLVCVEWPEIIYKVLPFKIVWIKIEINRNQSRQVSVKFPETKVG